jgi:hypothetical protein
VAEGAGAWLRLSSQGDEADRHGTPPLLDGQSRPEAGPRRRGEDRRRLARTVLLLLATIGADALLIEERPRLAIFRR